MLATSQLYQVGNAINYVCEKKLHMYSKTCLAPV